MVYSEVKTLVKSEVQARFTELTRTNSTNTAGRKVALPNESLSVSILILMS